MPLFGLTYPFFNLFFNLFLNLFFTCFSCFYLFLIISNVFSPPDSALVSNPLDPRYPLEWPPYKPWSQQYYHGDWLPKDDCDIHPYSPSELKTCFQNGEKSVAIVGDSRGRQLYRAAQLYTTEEKCCLHDWPFYRTFIQK